MKKIMIFGAVTCDIAAYVRELPKGNEDIELLRSERKLGGCGTHAARVLAGLRLPADLMAPCGTGVYAEEVRRMAAEAGLVLHCERDGVQGCTCHMIDPEGREAVISVPGAEYVYDDEDTSYADSDEISAVLCCGEMLTGETAADLADFLCRCDAPLCIVPDGHLEEVDEDVKETLLSLDASWLLRADEVSVLGGTDDFRDALVRLSEMTSGPVLVFSEDGSVFCRCGGEEMQTPESSGGSRKDAVLFAEAAYAGARAAGVDLRNSMVFAQGAAERYIRNGGVMDEFDWTEQRQRLVRMITYRS